MASGTAGLLFWGGPMVAMIRQTLGNSNMTLKTPAAKCPELTETKPSKLGGSQYQSMTSEYNSHEKQTKIGLLKHFKLLSILFFHLFFLIELLCSHLFPSLLFSHR